VETVDKEKDKVIAISKVISEKTRVVHLQLPHDTFAVIGHYNQSQS
jgi:hypothetical protein